MTMTTSVPTHGVVRYPHADEYVALENAWEAPDALGATAAERLAEYAASVAVPGVPMGRAPRRGCLVRSALAWVGIVIAALGFGAVLYGTFGV